MVMLLLSNGANALVMNDDCQTALDVARLKGYSNVVRAIENHICLFSGWLQELYGPGFLELLAPQLLSRKVWVVIVPCGALKPTKPFKLELVIYSGLQDAKPRTIIALWKANMDEPNFNQPDPSVVISSSTKLRVKLAPVNQNEKHQLQRFCNACKGIPQVMHPAFPFNNQGPDIGASAPTTPDDTDLALAISASLQSASLARPTAPNTYTSSGSTTSASWTNPNPNPTTQTAHSGKSQWEAHDAGTSSSPISYSEVVPNPIGPPPSVPSAPPVPDVLDDGPVNYPSIDPSPSVEDDDNKSSDSSTCVICLDAPVEGACIPCGHMAGCMTCLNEIKAKKWGCPVCRTKIDQVVRLYAV